MHPTGWAYETRLDSGPPASFVVLIERRVTKGRVELPSSREHDVLSIACLPVAPLGRESSCDKRRGPVIRFAQSCGTRHSALRSRLSTPHDPCGNRTRLASVRGWRPEPIDERAGHDLRTASGRSRTCIAQGGWVTATWVRPYPADAFWCAMANILQTEVIRAMDANVMARVGVEPTEHEGLNFAALPNCVPCHDG